MNARVNIQKTEAQKRLQWLRLYVFLCPCLALAFLVCAVMELIKPSDIWIETAFKVAGMGGAALVLAFSTLSARRETTGKVPPLSSNVYIFITCWLAWSGRSAGDEYHRENWFLFSVLAVMFVLTFMASIVSVWGWLAQSHRLKTDT